MGRRIYGSAIMQQLQRHTLKKDSLNFLVDEKSIAEVAQMDLNELYQWIIDLPKKLSANELKIGEEIIKEIKARTEFLLNVGLNYLALNRSSKSLSGGEAQRIRLATQIGSQLVGVLYILDEPSIGLHQRDNERLINSLCELRDIGNSVVVVEHDKDMIERADYVIDLGPYAGNNGGAIISKGKPSAIISDNSLTAAYLTGKKNIHIPTTRRSGNGEKLLLKGCAEITLKTLT